MWRGRKNLFIVINRAGKVTEKLGGGKGLQLIDTPTIRVSAAQDLLNLGASMPIIMQCGRWSKTDTVMRYLEHSCCTV